MPGRLPFLQASKDAEQHTVQVAVPDFMGSSTSQGANTIT